MLITKSKVVPISFQRDFKYNGDKLEVQDSIKLNSNENFERMMIGDEFFVRYVPQSMYFQNQELEVSGFMLDERAINKLNSKRELKIKRVIESNKGEVEREVLLDR